MHDKIDKLYDRKQTAELLGISSGSLLKRAYRAKLRLPAIHIGGKIMFAHSDIMVVMNRKERFDDSE